ncbi:hypothetical protein [Aquibacillus koreensis]|uniref:hypothetical protein n=1 Tax=Aquibacillus koreensis TaxID=279446 RepID=UPI002883085E|nr:hypothetical protein [Aquibacillus koreensis]
MPEWLSIVIRSISFIVVILLVAKVNGKKQLSKLSVFEYLAGLVIAFITAGVSVGLIPLTNGLVGLSIWFIIPFLISL